MDNRLPLYQNIMLSGGTTMLPGLATRLERDIRHLYLKHILKVLKSSHRNTRHGKNAHSISPSRPRKGGLSEQNGPSGKLSLQSNLRHCTSWAIAFASSRLILMRSAVNMQSKVFWSCTKCEVPCVCRAGRRVFRS